MLLFTESCKGARVLISSLLRTFGTSNVACGDGALFPSFVLFYIQRTKGNREHEISLVRNNISCIYMHYRHKKSRGIYAGRVWKSRTKGSDLDRGNLESLVKRNQNKNTWLIGEFFSFFSLSLSFVQLDI